LLQDTWITLCDKLTAYLQQSKVQIGDEKESRKSKKEILASFLNNCFQEHFRTGCDYDAFTQYYPHCKLLEDKKRQKVWVKNNRLYLDGCTSTLKGCDVILKRHFDFKNYPLFTIFLQLGRNDFLPGDWNIGLRLSQNSIVFHPGYPNGGIRVEGPGGFGNQNAPTGTPDPDIFHTIRVVIFYNGLVHFWIYNSNSGPLEDSKNHWSFKRENKWDSFDVGFRREGRISELGHGIGFYSDLIVAPGFHRTPPPYFQ